jgi:hypothetical protein
VDTGFRIASLPIKQDARENTGTIAAATCSPSYSK